MSNLALGILLFPLILFASLFVFAFVQARAELRLARDLLSSMLCPECGIPFGPDECRSAEAAWKSQREERYSENEGIRRVRFARWPVRCPHCGLETVYLPHTKSLLSGET